MKTKLKKGKTIIHKYIWKIGSKNKKQKLEKILGNVCKIIMYQRFMNICVIIRNSKPRKFNASYCS